MIFLPLLRSVMISAVAETVMAEARRSKKYEKRQHLLHYCVGSKSFCLHPYAEDVFGSSRVFVFFKTR
jgi:hypothetical protein